MDTRSLWSHVDSSIGSVEIEMDDLAGLTLYPVARWDDDDDEWDEEDEDWDLDEDEDMDDEDEDWEDDEDEDWEEDEDLDD